MDSPSPPSKTPAPRQTRLQRFTDHAVEAMWSWGIVLILVGVAPGLAAWPLVHEEQLSFVVDNKLDPAFRKDIVTWMAASFLVVVALYVAAWGYLRWRGVRLGFGEVCKRLNRYTFVAIATPLLTVLLHRGIETDHEFITLMLISIITVMFGVLLYRLIALRPDGASDTEVVRRRWLPPLMLAVLGAYYAGMLSYLALLDHHNLGTHVYDLGIYDNIIWSTSNGDFLGCTYCKGGKHMSSHFDPLLALLVPIYKVFPGAETLLVVQSVWLATGVIPLYLIAKRRLGNPWTGVILAFVYVWYPALHGVNLFDFHSLTLVVPTLMWAIYLIDIGAVWRYWLVFVVMITTREDMPLLACFVGAYAIVCRRPVTGLVTILLALAYLAVVKLYIMPDPGLLMSSKDTMSYIYFYEDMIPHADEGARGLVISLVTNPGFVLQVLTKEQKVFFFLALLIPLLFLPLVAGRKRVLMIYGLIFIGLASRRHVFSLHFQYSSVLFPVLLMSMPDAIDRASRSRLPAAYGLRPRRLVWTLLWTAAFATFLTSFKYGGMIPNDHFHAGWNRIARSPSKERDERYEFVKKLAASIPPDASVCSTSGLGPHISARKEASKWPSTRDADYLLLHIDSFKNKDDRRLDRLVRRGTYRKVEGAHGVELYERVPNEERAEMRKRVRQRRSKTDRGKTDKERPLIEPKGDEEDLDADANAPDDPRRRPLEEDGEAGRESSAPDDAE